MDLSASELPISVMCDVEGVEKAIFVQEMHQKVQENIERWNEHNACLANRGRKKVVFHPKDWVWVHFRKIRFPDKVKSKLDARGNGPFQILERMNDNAYIVDLPGDVLDLRTNHSQEGEDDMPMDASRQTTDPLGRPITRAMERKMQEGLSVFIREMFKEEEARHEGTQAMKTVLKIESTNRVHRLKGDHPTGWCALSRATQSGRAHWETWR